MGGSAISDKGLNGIVLARLSTIAPAFNRSTAAAEDVAGRREAFLVSTIKANSEDVGTRFPEEARKIHYGEADARGIIGQTTLDEGRALLEEGIEIAALPVLPDDVN